MYFDFFICPAVRSLNLGPALFIITIIGSILVAWATVGYTAIKAALANPARSLRNE